MKRYLIPLPNGKFLDVKRNVVDNALPYINRRLEYFLPIECVDKKEIQKVIGYIRVNVNRDCTKDEVNGLVASIKNLLLEALDNMPTYERHMWNEYKYDDDMEGDPNDNT